MIKETDNTNSVLQEIKDKIELGLKLTGEICEGYAKISTKMGGRCPVDTGLLKNSISYAVKENSGKFRMQSEILLAPSRTCTELRCFLKAWMMTVRK